MSIEYDGKGEMLMVGVSCPVQQPGSYLDRSSALSLWESNPHRGR